MNVSTTNKEETQTHHENPFFYYSLAYGRVCSVIDDLLSLLPYSLPRKFSCADACYPCRTGPFLLEKEEDRSLLIKAVLHASDISNPVRPFHVNCVMSSSVHREFRWASAVAHCLVIIQV